MTKYVGCEKTLANLKSGSGTIASTYVHKFDCGHTHCLMLRVCTLLPLSALWGHGRHSDLFYSVEGT